MTSEAALEAAARQLARRSVPIGSSGFFRDALALKYRECWMRCAARLKQRTRSPAPATITRHMTHPLEDENRRLREALAGLRHIAECG